MTKKTKGWILSVLIVATVLVLGGQEAGFPNSYPVWVSAVLVVLTFIATVFYLRDKTPQVTTDEEFIYRDWAAYRPDSDDYL